MGRGTCRPGTSVAVPLTKAPEYPAQGVLRGRVRKPLCVGVPQVRDILQDHFMSSFDVLLKSLRVEIELSLLRIINMLLAVL